jgi:hypothetical protein
VPDSSQSSRHSESSPTIRSRACAAFQQEVRRIQGGDPGAAWWLRSNDGGFLTARVQKRQWARGQQIEACATIVVESTCVQLALRGQWKHDQRVDWTPWNEALAKISLVADRTVVDAAGETDAVFWQHNDRLDRGCRGTSESVQRRTGERVELSGGAGGR